MRASAPTAVLLVLIVVASLAAASAFWFVCDDAFISFRYARNWAEGHGLVYNVGEGEPVEGYSNFLWVALAALLELARLPPAGVLPLVSMGCAAALLLVLFRSAQDRLGLDPAPALAAVLSLAAAPGFVVWSTSGLETLPAALLLYLVFHHWVLGDEPGDARRGALAALGLALIRTEGVLWVIVLAGLAALRRALEADRRGGRLGRALAGVLAVYAAYFAVRYAWFGTLLANTASAKVQADPERFARGLDYVAGFWLEYLAGPVQLLLLPLAWRVARWRGLLVGAVAAGAPLYAVLVGGDFMAMGRLLVPGLPFGALLVGSAVQALGRAPALRAGALTAAVGLGGLGALPLLDVQLVPGHVRSDFRVRFNIRTFRTEHAQWRFMRANARSWTTLGKALHQVEAPGDAIVLGAIGAVGYHTRLHVHDRYGLVSREVVTRGRAAKRPQSPGHDLVVPPTFFRDAEPTFLYADWLPAQGALRGVRSKLAGWRRPAVVDRYGPRLHALEVDGEHGWLLVLQRMEAPERAWADLDARLAEAAPGATP